MSGVVEILDLLAAIARWLMALLLIRHAFKAEREREPSRERSDLVIVCCSLSMLLLGVGV